MDSNNKQEEVVKKEFAIKLENMEQINLKDGRQFFKLYDASTDSYIMIINNDRSKNMSEQFKDIQNMMLSAQTQNATMNARGIYDTEAKYSRTVLSLTPINEMYKVMNQIGDARKRQMLITLIKSSQMLKLRFVNVDNCIAIDEQGKVISAYFNENTNKVELDVADALKFDANSVTSLNSQYDEIDLSSIDFDQIVEEIEVSDDMPIEIAGEKIDPKFVKQAYEYPELVERSTQVNNKQRFILQHIIMAMRKRQMNKQNSNSKQKVYVKNNQTAFVNKLVLAVLAGIAIGVLLCFLMTYFMV